MIEATLSNPTAPIRDDLAIRWTALACELHRRRTVVLYILTHGQCHIPVETVQQLRGLAFLYGVFVLPSQGVAVSYAPLLHHAEIVDEEALSNRVERRRRALGIVEGAGQPGSPKGAPSAASASPGAPPRAVRS